VGLSQYREETITFSLKEEKTPLMGASVHESGQPMIDKQKLFLPS